MIEELKKLMDDITLNIESEKRQEKLSKAAESGMNTYHIGKIHAFESVALKINSIIRLNDTK